MESTYIDRAAWLGLGRRAEADHDLPDGRRLRLRELSCEERLAAQEVGDPDPETRIYRNPGGMYAYIVVCGAIDPATAQPLFGPDDIPALLDLRGGIRQSGLDIRSVGDAIWRLSEADAPSFRGVDAAPDHAGDADPDIRAPDRAGDANPGGA